MVFAGVDTTGDDNTTGSPLLYVTGSSGLTTGDKN